MILLLHSPTDNRWGVFSYVPSLSLDKHTEVCYTDGSIPMNVTT